MKSFFLLAFMVLCIAFTFSSCQNSESDKIKDEARQSLPQPPAPPATTANPQPFSPGTTPSATAEPHYKCPNNCAGGVGDAAGTCGTCGTALAHNQAFHNQANASPATTPTDATQQPAAAQNAAGVYHYTCSNGCAGGSGSAGACATCGSALAHNQAYHN